MVISHDDTFLKHNIWWENVLTFESANFAPQSK